MENESPHSEPIADHVVIAGYGLPGRTVAEVLRQQKIAHCIIEFNHETVSRCAAGGTPIIAGDARDPATLRQAGVERAKTIAVTIPDDRVMLEIVRIARKLNPGIEVVARCSYTSSGIEATQRGASEVVVAEQIVAVEFSRVILKRLVADAAPRA
jgi:CPA2 family monovalent cation:H+ antiporter-2